MKKFEYKIETFGLGRNDKIALKELNKFGKAEWDLIAVVQIDPKNPYIIKGIFKREYNK